MIRLIKIVILLVLILHMINHKKFVIASPYVNNNSYFNMAYSFSSYNTPLDLKRDFMHYSKYYQLYNYNLDGWITDDFSKYDSSKYFYLTGNSIIMNWQKNCNPNDPRASHILATKLVFPKNVIVRIKARDLQGISPYNSQWMRISVGLVKFSQTDKKIYGYYIHFDEGLTGEDDLVISTLNPSKTFVRYYLPPQYKDSSYHIFEVNFKTMQIKIDGNIVLNSHNAPDVIDSGHVSFGAWCKSVAEFEWVQIKVIPESVPVKIFGVEKKVVKLVRI